MAKNKDNGVGFEQKLWQLAEKFRKNMDAAEYKHLFLGLIFLKYISDSFLEMHERLKSGQYADPEDKEEYLASNVFWVPPEARWEYLQDHAKKQDIGELIDDAMDSIEKDNPKLIGVLPKEYTRKGLDKKSLGGVINLIGTIGLGDKEKKSKDILGRVYEYFLGQFSNAEGKKGYPFYTPRSIVKLLVEMIEPYSGRIYDPCCGSGGMFVQSEKFVKAHNGQLDDISIYGQESKSSIWQICKMNLIIRGIDANIELGNSLNNDKFEDLKADYILANPPFNENFEREQLQNDVRWKYGLSPKGNANFAWAQHYIYHLNPTGIAGFVLPNSSVSNTGTAEERIRTNIVESDLVDCIITLPSQLFSNTNMPACLWFITKDKSNKFRDRSREILFIDSSKMGSMIDRTHRELTDNDISKITTTYHAWRGESGEYKDIRGFCKTLKLDELREHNHILSPGRYVGVEIEEEDEEIFQEKIKRLNTELKEQFEKSKKIEESIIINLSELGYE